MHNLWSKNYLLFCANNHLQFLAHFLLMTTLPIVATLALHASPEEVGMICGIYMLGSLISRPIMGHLADSYDKKKLLMVTFLLFLLPFILYFFADTIPELIALRLLHGLAFGALSTVTVASVADVIPPARIGEGISYFAMFMTLSSILGPMLGLYLIEQNFSYMYLAGLFFAALIFFTILFLQLPPGKKCPASEKQPICWHQFIEPKALPVGLLGGMNAFAFSAVATFITLYAADLNILASAPYFFLISALAIFVSRPFVGRAFDKYGPNFIIQPCFLVFAIGLMCLSHIDTGKELILCGILIGAGNGSLFSSLQSLALKTAPANRQGAATSTYFICFDLAGAAGAFCFGPLTTAIGFDDTYLAGSFILLLACPVYYMLYQRKAPKIPPG